MTALLLTHLETFDNYILEHHLEAASRLPFTTLLNHPEYTHLFDHHGGAILSRKVLRSHTGRKAVISVTSFVARLVRHILNWKRGPLKDIKSLRSIYTANICGAMMALDMKVFQEYLTGVKGPEALNLWSMRDLRPAVAAAIGDIDTLRDILTLPDLLPPHCELFPNALHAAVASGQTAVVEFILEFISTNVKEKRDSGSWDEMRSQARVLSSALRVAIRLHNNKAASLMLDFISTFRALDRSMPLFFKVNLIKDCMRHGNVAILDEALPYKSTGYPTSKDAVSPKDLQLTEEEMESVFKIGHQSSLRHLLKDGRLCANSFEQYKRDYRENSPQPLAERTPLMVALENLRYDLARVLLAHGANVNGTPRTNHCGKKGDDRTALWHAAINGHVQDVQFLLSYKADPIVSTKQEWLSPLDAASRWRKCTYLLETAIREGHEAVLHPDIWERYEDHMEFERERWNF